MKLFHELFIFFHSVSNRNLATLTGMGNSLNDMIVQTCVWTLLKKTSVYTESKQTL